MAAGRTEPPASECPESIAICGMGCRWPGGVANTSELWDLLREKRSGWGEFTPDRINVEGFYHPNGQRPGSMYTRGGYVLKEDTKNFDNNFFGISPAETVTLDPSQRKLLEVTYEAFENAGKRWDQFSGSRTGVFIGNFNSDHKLMQFRDPDHTLPYVVTGGGDTILANRINYVFNLQGPSLTVDTACSASMYALHLAVSAMRNGECDAAIVASSNMILSPEVQIFTTKLGAVSPTSMCHTFDASADGYARAEGVGAIYLKRLSDAVADGDPIRSVIRGTAFNANGKTGGISHPSPDGQEAVIRQAYKSAGNLNPDLTGYFECHGTGTPVGDPIEVSALGRVFAEGRTGEPLLIGSIKTNLGHSEATSGLSQIMKSVLALEHGEIPATIGIQNFNPAIDFQGARAKVVQDMTPWPKGLYRRISINSFGYGGANAHCILDHPSHVLPGYKLPGIRLSTRKLLINGLPKAVTNGLANGHGDANGYTNGSTHTDTNGVMRPAYAKPQHTSWLSPVDQVKASDECERRLLLLPFSAHDDQCLKDNVAALVHSMDDYKLEDLAYTLGSRTSRFSRRAFVVVDRDQAHQDLERGPLTTGKIPSTQAQRIGFVFTGQGAQWPEMGARLIQDYHVFRDTIRYLDNILSKLSLKPSWTMEDALQAPASSSRVQEPEYSQTLCTGLQIALVSLLRTWGIEPVATVGHSSGEMAAAYAAGRLTAAEAIIFAYFRGQAVMRNEKEGRMMAVGLGPEQIAPYLEGIEHLVKIGAVNSPESVTLSGETEHVMELHNRLDTAQIFNRVLKTGGTAYHSHHMKALGEWFEQQTTQGLQEIGADSSRESLRPLQTWISSVAPAKAIDRAGPGYWRQNLESPVLFSHAVQAMAKSTSLDLLIEVGPHPALGGPLKQIRGALEAEEINLPPCLASLRRGEDDMTSMLTLGGNLFLKNAPVDLVAVNATLTAGDEGMKMTHGHFCVDLPKYKFNYPAVPLHHENRLEREYRTRKYPRHDLLGARHAGGSRTHPAWRNVLRMKDVPWLEDHKLLPDAIFPGAGYITMAVEAARQIHSEAEDALPIQAFKLRNVVINSTLQVPDDDAGIETILNMEAVPLPNTNTLPRWLKWSIGSMTYDTRVWTEHCSGSISIETKPTSSKNKLAVDSRSRALDISLWHEKFAEKGLGYGPAFRGLSNLRAYHGSKSAAANASLAPTSGVVKGGESYYPLHPATLDTCFQLAIIAFNCGQVEDMDTAFVPIVADELTVWMPETTHAAGDQGQAVSTGTKRGLRGAYSDIQLETSSGAPLLDIRNLHMVAYDGAMDAGELKLSREPYQKTVAAVDIDSLSSEQARSMFVAATDPRITSGALQDFDRFCAYVVANLPFGEQSEEPSEANSAHDHFTRWIQHWRVNAKAGLIAYGASAIDSDESTRLSVIEKLATQLDDIPEVKCLKLLHDNAGRILSADSDTNSVKLLMEESLLQPLYANGMGTRSAYAQAQRVVNLLAHKNPRMRILEIGGGTGAATRQVLDTLRGDSTCRRFQEYVFTDKARWSLAAAQDDLSSYNGVLYKALDLESDPLSQGFQEDYDLIIACNSMSELQDPLTGVQQARRLLKPGGKLLLVEQTEQRLGFDLLSRIMTGKWWLPTTPLQTSPVMSQGSWAKMLSQNSGFTGLDLVLHDQPRGTALASVMLSTSIAPAETQNPAQTITRTVYLQYRGSISPLSRAISAQLAAQGIKAVHCNLRKDAVPDDATVVSLIDLEGVTLTTCSEDHFKALQTTIVRASNLLWVSPGSLVSAHKPESGIMKGLLRSVATENSLKTIGYIELDRGFTRHLATTAHHIASKTQHLLQAKPGDGADREWSLSDGLLHVERLLPDSRLNEQFRLRGGIDNDLALRPMDSSGPLRARYSQIGVLSSLYFEADPAFNEALEDDWVEIETKAIGLNLKDVAVATGKFDSDFLSSEVAGIITQVGRSVSDLGVGDRVFGLVQGQMGNFKRSRASLVKKIGSRDTFEAATSMPMVYLTAIYALLHVARLTKGESVLIQSATGGLGMAAMRIAKHVGAEIYATVGNDQKREMLVKEFGVRSDHIFSSRELTAGEDILQATNGNGIDVILCSSPGEMAQESWRCIAPLGRFVDVGRTNVLGTGELAMEIFRRNATFASFDLQLMCRQKPALVASLMNELQTLWQQGVIGPIEHIKTFDVSRLEEAMMYFGKGLHTGKLVIDYSNPKAELNISLTAARTTFDPDAAYLLVGCLGGLGRSLATWMIQRGAKHLSFLSRSGADKPEAAALVQELQSLGAEPEVIRCSVTDSAAVSSAVHSLNVSRPLRGVLHAAMVEGDSAFANANHATISSVLAPKVSGSKNLAEATADLPLDFFLMTSSVVASVGTATQAAYCAANAYQDSLARSLRSANPRFPALALALGVITEVGSVSALPGFLGTLQRTTTYGISETELLRLFDGAMASLTSTPAAAEGSIECPPHLVLGLEPSRFLPHAARDALSDLTWHRDARFAGISQAIVDQASASASAANSSGSKSSAADLLNAAETVAEKTAIALAAVTGKLSKLVGMDEDEIDPAQPLLRYGVDSMVAAEVRGWLGRVFGVEVALVELLGKSASVGGLVTKMVGGEAKDAVNTDSKEIEKERNDIAA